MTAMRCLHRMSHRSLQLLLLGLAHKGRLSSKCLLEMTEEFGYIHSVPSATPVSQVWVVHSSLDANMLPRTHQHIPAWGHINHRRLLRVGLGYPYLDGKAICRSSKVYRQRPGDCKKQCRTAIFVGVDFGSRTQGWEDG